MLDKAHFSISGKIILRALLLVILNCLFCVFVSQSSIVYGMCRLHCELLFYGASNLTRVEYFIESRRMHATLATLSTQAHESDRINAIEAIDGIDAINAIEGSEAIDAINEIDAIDAIYSFD